MREKQKAAEEKKVGIMKFTALRRAEGFLKSCGMVTQATESGGGGGGKSK